jgi:hypothetical protein
VSEERRRSGLDFSEDLDTLRSERTFRTGDLEAFRCSLGRLRGGDERRRGGDRDRLMGDTGRFFRDSSASSSRVLLLVGEGDGLIVSPSSSSRAGVERRGGTTFPPVVFLIFLRSGVDERVFSVNGRFFSAISNRNCDI